MIFKASVQSTNDIKSELSQLTHYIIKKKEKKE